MLRYFDLSNSNAGTLFISASGLTNKQDIENYAFFGNVEYDVMSDWTLKAAVIPVSRDVRDGLAQRYSCRIGTLYGLADVGTPLFSGFDFPDNSCGRPLSGTWSVRLLKQDGSEAAIGESGEVAIRALFPEALALGYWRMPKETDACIRGNGWIVTGDLMRCDDEGWYYFVDRTKDSIRRRGENISSSEVEAVFATHDKVLDCAAYPVPNEMAEDDIMLAVIAKTGQVLDPLELVRFAETRLPYFAIPRFIRVMKDFPRTATQKVLKSQLRQQGRTPDCVDIEALGYTVRR